LHSDNLLIERPTFVSHLECSYTGERYPADEVHNLSRAGKPLIGRMVYFDTLTMELRIHKLRKDPNCPACVMNTVCAYYKASKKGKRI